MKRELSSKNMRKAFTILAGLLLLLAFAQCKKNKENQENEENFELTCDAIEYIDTNIQTKLELLNDKTTPEAMAALAEWVKSQEGVASAVAFDNRVEIVHVDGTKGSIIVYDQTVIDDSNPGRGHEIPSVKLQNAVVVGNQKGFIYDAFPYLDPEIDEGAIIQKLFVDNGFQYKHPIEETCTIDTLKTMVQFGYVHLITHGGTDEFATGEKVTRKKLKRYKESLDDDLIRYYDLIIKKVDGIEYTGNFFTVTTKFINGLQNRFNNAIIFNGGCDGFTENSALRDAFLGHGASTYIGFDNTAHSEFTSDVSKTILEYLFQGYSVGNAYDKNCIGNHCHTYIDQDEVTGDIIVLYETCVELAGRRDVVWYENTNVPIVTTHEVPSENIDTTTATVTGSVVFPNPSPIDYERGFIYYTLPDGLDAIQVVYPGTDLLNFSYTLTGLSPNTTYNLMAYSRCEDNQVVVGNIESFTTLSGSGPDPGTPEYVDLGLPSGTLWATCNVGAETPDEYGDYFAWGETQPKDYYDWSTYQYCNGSENTLTKYCNNSSYGDNGFTDNLTTLFPEDDAATANWGSDWRMPTKEEWQELLSNTTVTWTTQNGVNGRLFTASNGNSLFLPAAGNRWGGGLGSAGSLGYYWSSSLYTDIPDSAWGLDFYSGYSGVSYYGRDYGFSVRPVRATSQVTSYVVNATPSPADGGNIQISGGSNNGATCTLTAEANEGYIFANWTENGTVVSTDATYSFTLTSDRTLVANFTVNTVNYTVSVSANPMSGGSVTGWGTYQQGQSCTVTASANSGYTFTNWTEDGFVVSTEATYSFTVTDNRMLVANFVVNSIGGHEYVDLGLPSGLLWATCNVGANAPEEYGDYFAWGETQPKDYYDWSTYQYCNGSAYTLTKYCSNSDFGYNGFTDNLTTLLPEDDAATANWGNGWRMPTKQEWQELYNNTTHIWTTQNGVSGRLFTASNGNSLFLPAAGYRSWSSLEHAGRDGNYWSSSLYTDYPHRTWFFDFDLSSTRMYFDIRSIGQPVRAAREN